MNQFLILVANSLSPTNVVYIFILVLTNIQTGIFSGLMHQNYLIDNLSNLITSVSFAAAAWWFFRRGENIVRANISHKIVTRQIESEVYVAVSVEIHNIGKIRLKPVIEDSYRSQVIIEEIAPYLSTPENQNPQDKSPEYSLRRLGMRYFPINMIIEPGEIQQILFEFLISSDVTMIKVYSYVENRYNDKSIGWNTTTVHEVLV